MKYALLPVLLLLICVHASSQTTLPVTRNVAGAVAKGSRTLKGLPGTHYWQNGADYTIEVSFDPVTLMLKGTETIAYKNNSEDTLKELLFKLYPNFYQKGAIRATPIDAQDVSDGVTITDLMIDQKPHPVKKTTGTNLRVRDQTILPHSTSQVSLGFSYTLNRTSHQRTGAVDSSSFFIAYFFPRIAVYDDIDGWNRNPYTGSQEFYNDFCHFSVSLTLPKNYVAWGTGYLVNAKEVLAKQYVDRLATAEQQDGIVAVIDSSDVLRKDITPQHDNIWKFDADDVTDFVFATSDHYCWNASSVLVDSAAKRRTRVDVAFNPAHEDFKEVISFARKTVSFMSYQFPKWPFPYAHETVFDGLDQMEYPMMVNDNPLKNREDAITLTDHEIFHTMFPFYMGINETKNAWMDEGWATIGEWLISPMIDTAIEDSYGMEPYNKNAGNDEDLPIIIPSTQQSGTAYFLNSYDKPALGYLYAKDILGDDLFFKGLHHYIALWKGKHPAPLDFFSSMNAGSGKNLDWFWKKWFYDDGVPDLAITSAKKTPTGYSVTITSIGTKPVPVDLTIFFDDGNSTLIHRAPSCWEKGNKTVVINFTAPHKPVRGVLGSLYVPDVNKQDNELLFDLSRKTPR